MCQKLETVVIGAGQAGLAMSRCLTAHGIDHIVLDRGAIAGRWRTERWASLRLLTPNWMTRLPGHEYAGRDPLGFMHKDEVVAFLNRYARGFAAPVREFTTVHRVSREAHGFRVTTDGPDFLARSVVIATGACDLPKVPGWARNLPDSVEQVTTNRYVHPGDLARGGVLVVGGSATGVQLAEEIHRSGRPVTLACGSHVSLPRRYRGRDIMRWMDLSGLHTEIRDPNVPSEKVLSQPSPQLIGGGRDINLGTLMAEGIRVVGRANGVSGHKVALSGTLEADMNKARAKSARVLGRIDDFIEAEGLGAPAQDIGRAPQAPKDDPTTLDLRDGEIRTVVWATGFRRQYPWLNIDVTEPSGELRQSGGVCPVPGLYALGLPFMRRRSSTSLDGVGADARELAAHLSSYLARPRAKAA